MHCTVWYGYSYNCAVGKKTDKQIKWQEKYIIYFPLQMSHGETTMKQHVHVCLQGKVIDRHYANVKWGSKSLYMKKKIAGWFISGWHTTWYINQSTSQLLNTCNNNSQAYPGLTAHTRFKYIIVFWVIFRLSFEWMCSTCSLVLSILSSRIKSFNLLLNVFIVSRFLKVAFVHIFVCDKLVNQLNFSDKKKKRALTVKEMSKANFSVKVNDTFI